MKTFNVEALLGDFLERLDKAEKIDAINDIKRQLQKHSPFATEPVDCVIWVPSDLVEANDYNPNSVAPPEMALLEQSILQDGYTQPIVTWLREGIYEVVDGFHRNRIGKESLEVRKRVHSFLPVVVINHGREDITDRMASTIRHNRARGKHKVEAMSDIVIELKRRNWSNEKIAKNLGMDQDEILRLCQITGLQELFADQEFSKSWDIDDAEDDFTPLQENDGDKVKIEPNRILHTWDKWECYPAGFYENKKDGMTKEQCNEEYRAFLSNIPRFEAAMERVTTEWKNSCQHYLTNENMNRIAWMGQAALCIETGIPSIFRGGFMLLTEDQQRQANEAALKYVNRWLIGNDRAEITMEDATGKTEANLY